MDWAHSPRTISARTKPQLIALSDFSRCSKAKSSIIDPPYPYDAVKRRSAYLGNRKRTIVMISLRPEIGSFRPSIQLALSFPFSSFFSLLLPFSFPFLTRSIISWLGFSPHPDFFFYYYYFHSFIWDLWAATCADHYPDYRSWSLSPCGEQDKHLLHQ